MVALSAVEPSILAHLAMVLTTIRAEHIITPSILNDDFFADIIVIEVVSHCKETVEL